MFSTGGPASGYIQQYQDNINQITNPYNQQSANPMTGPGQPNNASSGYALNNDYAVGNRIYNGISPSPHAGGGLDPVGFQQRDQQAAVKNNLLANKVGGF